jgi:hypothetical protein
LQGQLLGVAAFAAAGSARNEDEAGSLFISLHSKNIFP